MSPPVLYHLSLKGNGAHMIGSCDEVDPASGVPTCVTCGYRTDPDFTNPGFRMRRRRLDISCCYDGAVIVSDRFRTLYASLGGSNLRFVDLPKAPGFHHLTCITPIALDYAAMGDAVPALVLRLWPPPGCRGLRHPRARSRCASGG